MLDRVRSEIADVDEENVDGGSQNDADEGREVTGALYEGDHQAAYGGAVFSPVHGGGGGAVQVEIPEGMALHGSPSAMRAVMQPDGSPGSVSVQSPNTRLRR